VACPTFDFVSKVLFRYYSSWFCPFANRATIALEHHKSVISYEWEEALGWQQTPPDGEENFDSTERDDWWYHWKSPGLLKANPQGMIPTIVDESTGRSVTESLVCIEFLDELACSASSQAPSLMPSCPYERARARVAADRVNKQVCSAYYGTLVKESDEDRAAAFGSLKEGLRLFAAELKGDFWGGDSLSLVDLVLLPYAHRLYVLEHYRGPEFAVPVGGDDVWDRYNSWLERTGALDAVAVTIPDRDRYLHHVGKYAHAKARSKVGNAVRRGVAAHDYDHKVDG